MGRFGIRELVIKFVYKTYYQSTHLTQIAAVRLSTARVGSIVPFLHTYLGMRYSWRIRRRAKNRLRGVTLRRLELAGR